jgi:hypothetical protein
MLTAPFLILALRGLKLPKIGKSSRKNGFVGMIPRGRSMWRALRGNIPRTGIIRWE